MDFEVKLKAEKVTKAFAGIKALKGVDFDLRKGEVHALVGANGAGKSTLIKIINGAVIPDSGKIFIDGNEVKINSPEDARKCGVAAVYQELSLVNCLSVAENIFLGRLPLKPGNAIKGIHWGFIEQEADRILKSLDCEIDPRKLVRRLSVAQRQVVEIAKALATDSKIIIFDEPTASLTEHEIVNLFRVIKNLASEGYSIVYISHRLEELPEIANRVTVFKDGMNVATLDIQDAPKEKIVNMMVGSALEHSSRNSTVTDEKLLEIRKFTRKPYFSDINLTLHKGEILGIAGLAGAGRTELVRALFGLDGFESGEVYINSQRVNIKAPKDAIKNGIGFITEDRKEEGLILIHDIRRNISITVLDKLRKLFSIDKKAEDDLCNQFVKNFSIKISGLHQKAKNLSGGNQQKVVISKWLATKPKILILDEPTKGVDVGAKGQIYSIINELVDKGLGVIVISSEIPEILEVCDRIVVMAAGKITGEMNASEANQERILHCATSKVKVCSLN